MWTNQGLPAWQFEVGEETRRCMSGAVCGALFSVRKYVIITIIILFEMSTHWEREIFAYRPILVKCS